MAKDLTRARAELEEGLRGAPGDADLLAALAGVEHSLGNWDSALVHVQHAQALDPLSVTTARKLAMNLLYLRRYPEAQAAYDLALTLAPTNLELIERRAMVRLAQGDLGGARAYIRGILATVDTTALIAYLAVYKDLFWVLEDPEQRRLLRLTPAAFDGDRATWATVLAETHWHRGDRARARAYADSARVALEEQSRNASEDGQRHLLLGLMHAYLGRKADAVREGERGVGILGLAKDRFFGAYNQVLMMRIYLLVGEHEKALDQAEALVAVPYYISPGWLRVDPMFAEVRGHPRFERPVGGA